MLPLRRLARLAILVAALAAVPGLAIAAGMGGGAGTGASMGGGGMMGNGMNNMMTGSYGTTTTGSSVVDPKHPDAPTDPSLRNFSHTGLRNPLHVSKAWQDVPLSDSSVAGALAPVPQLPPAGGSSK